MVRASESADSGGVDRIVCVRCGISVTINSGPSSVTLTYDVEDWQHSTCCCTRMDGPMGCCSFLALEGAIRALPKRPDADTP